MCQSLIIALTLDTEIAGASALIAVISTLIALFALFITVKFQGVSFVNSQLIDIAKTCNSYLYEDYQVHLDNKISRGRASGIVTALEDAEHVITQAYENHWFVNKSNKAQFRKTFFTHLHSSIRDFLKRRLMKGEGFFYGDDNPHDPIRTEQLDNAVKFFGEEIRKVWRFEKERADRLQIK